MGQAVLLVANLTPIPSLICWLDDTDLGLRFNSPLEMNALETWITAVRAVETKLGTAVRLMGA